MKQPPRPSTCPRRPRAAERNRVGPIVFLFVVCGSALATSEALAEPQADKSAAFEHFENHVRPLLSERCFGCHGEKKQWAGLRLDSRNGLLKGGDTGPAVVPGRPTDSELIRRVAEVDDDLRMPPADSGRALSKLEIAALEEWIRRGAVWPKELGETRTSPAGDWRRHWAFQPVRRVAPPEVEQVDRVSTPVDRFILRQLEKHELGLSPPADRRTLIRRATYDLLGMPPSPDEVEAFVADDSPDAYAKLVDRLLESPHYGEHWGRHWLDVARYSDTKGYVYAREERTFVHAHLYRDWVIRAFNDDLPYDRFLKRQIAADQVVPEDRQALAAMGFLTLGRRFLGVTPDIIDDRIDVVTRGTMGLTVSCARCHDHKYDPIPAADYYSLYGIFQSSFEAMTELPRASHVPAPTKEFEAGFRSRKQKLAETIAARAAEASERVRARVADYLHAQQELEKYPPQGFDQILSKDDLIPAIVWRWRDYLTASARDDDPVFVPWRKFLSLGEGDFAAGAAAVAQQIQQSAGAVNPRIAAAFAVPPTSPREVADRYGQVFGEIDRAWRDLCKDARNKNLPLPDGLPGAPDEALRQVLYGSGAPGVIPPEPIVNTEAFYDSGTVTELWKLQGEVDRWLLQSPESIPHVMHLRDRESAVVPRIFRRGNPATPGDEVPRQFVTLLSGENPKPFVQGSGRLELARSIASSENPLTARVWVNRVWMHHFGRGLVATPSDFGLRAEPPSHPDLLDWLADDFVRSGWSTKALHRRILLSSAYRQRSGEPEDRALGTRAQQHDPENRLLWRMNPRRLSFEEYRDTLITVAGELDPTVGGRAVEFFPAGRSFRRSVYGRIDRQFVPGVLRVFDFANPDLHAPQRSETSIPQQALFALNHPFVADRARALAANVSAPANADPESNVARLYRRLFQREPSSPELAAAMAFLTAGDGTPADAAFPPEALAWSYGSGEVDAAAGKTKVFTPLPYFNGSAWQGGPQWPDAKLGWAQLTAGGGHAGNDLQHAVVRRWTAPAPLRVAIRSTLVHEVAAGDGVRGWMISSRQGVLQQSVAHNAKVPFERAELDVEAGETLDFVVDFRANLNSDQFLWAPTIEAAGATELPLSERHWNAEKNFAGQPMTNLKPLEQLAQVLLLSNEFMFVD